MRKGKEGSTSDRLKEGSRSSAGEECKIQRTSLLKRKGGEIIVFVFFVGKKVTGHFERKADHPPGRSFENTGSFWGGGKRLLKVREGKGMCPQEEPFGRNKVDQTRKEKHGAIKFLRRRNMS